MYHVFHPAERGIDLQRLPRKVLRAILPNIEPRYVVIAMNTQTFRILLGFVVLGIVFTGGVAASPITGPSTADAPITQDRPITQSPITADTPITADRPITQSPITQSPITADAPITQ